MYKEVAFDPSCMANMEYYGLVKQHFGFEKGRYIAADVKVWAKEAMQHVKGSALQPVKKQSVKAFLNKLVTSKSHEHFLLTDDRKNIECGSWSEWWVAQCGVRDFDFTITEAQGPKCVSIDLINSGSQLWELAPSVSVKRNAKEIVSILLPLAILSKEITIVDPYFRVSENETLKELFPALEVSKVRSLRIVNSMDSPNFQAAYDAQYKALNKNNIRVEWVRAKDKFFHDRYFITEVGAIRCGHGFVPDVEKGVAADFLNLNLVSREECERVLDSINDQLEMGAVVSRKIQN